MSIGRIAKPARTRPYFPSRPAKKRAVPARRTQPVRPARRTVRTKRR